MGLDFIFGHHIEYRTLLLRTLFPSFLFTSVLADRDCLHAVLAGDWEHEAALSELIPPCCFSWLGFQAVWAFNLCHYPDVMASAVGVILKLHSTMVISKSKALS